jgi:pyruvate dehydrogenase E2 component (dihydrolipoamide acetyltransferase)
MSEGKVTKWLKKEGDAIRKGEPLFEIESEKLTSVVDAEESGVLRKIVVPEGSNVPVGDVVCILTISGEEFPQAATRAEGPVLLGERRETVDVERPEEAHQLGEKVSPLARRLAQNLGIDISKVKGTGPDGRIVKDDILKAAQAGSQEARVEPLRVADTGEMSVARKAIADKLTRSHLTAAHVTITTSVDMTETITLRERLAPEIENRTGAKLSYTDIIVKLVSLALKEYPTVNSSLEGDKIKLFSDINIGVAVALEDSLIVPVVLSADKKSLAEIATLLGDRIEKARTGQLSVDEVTGGTFTVSNLGIYDIEVFTPIINPPECAILGVGKILPKPWAVGEEIKIRPIATLSLSFDHRIIDGAKAAAFLQKVKQSLQKPEEALG